MTQEEYVLKYGSSKFIIEAHFDENWVKFIDGTIEPYNPDIHFEQMHDQIKIGDAGNRLSWFEPNASRT